MSMATPEDISKLLDLVAELRDEKRDLLGALKEAVVTIKALHREPGWDIYERCSPEMKLIKAAIAKAEGR